MNVVRKFDSAAGAKDGYALVHLVDDKIYAVPRRGNIIEEYDVKTTALHTRPLNIAEELLTKTVVVNRTLLERLLLPLYREGGLFTTERFLNTVSNDCYVETRKHDEMNATSINNGSAGQSIYRSVKTEVLCNY